MKIHLLFLLTVSTLLNAQVFTDSIDGRSGVMLAMNGLSDEYRNLPTATDSGSLSVTIDAPNRLMYLNYISVLGASSTVSFSKDIVTELGKPAKTISAEISFDSPSLHLSNLGPYALVQNPDGSFETDFFMGALAHTFQFELSGDYRISDGTTMFEGDFSVVANDSSWISTIGISFDGYPNEIVVGRSGVSPWRYFDFPDPDLVLFSVQFDGTPVSISVERYSIASENLVTLAAVPEASSIGCIMGFFSLIFIVALRICRSTKKIYNW